MEILWTEKERARTAEQTVRRLLLNTVLNRHLRPSSSKGGTGTGEREDLQGGRDGR